MSMSMSIRKSKTSKRNLANAINATLNQLANNSSAWAVDTSSNAGYHLASDWLANAYPANPNIHTTKLEMPEWVDVEDGYDIEVFKVDNGHVMSNVTPVVATYRPKKTLSVGFVRIYFVDDDGKPFPQMKGVWSEFLHTPYNGNICGCTLDYSGRVSGAFGIPDVKSIYTVACQMYSVYDTWKDYPNESDFDMVKRLIVALGDVRTMQRIEEDKSYASDIERKRKKIQELQEEISQLEKVMNDIYEKAADAMNLLEDHGVNVEKAIKSIDNGISLNDWSLSPDGTISPIMVSPNDINKWMNYATITTCDSGISEYTCAASGS